LKIRIQARAEIVRLANVHNPTLGITEAVYAGIRWNSSRRGSVA